VLRPDAVVRRVREAIPGLLEECEGAGLRGYVPVDAFLRIRSPALFARLTKLKIASIACYENLGSGKLHFGMTGFGGAVDPTGRDVPKWIGEFLRAAERRDVLTKLRASGALECHVFVIASFGGIPWLVESYLGTRTDLVPSEAPDLPDPVGSVWIMCGPRGVRWAGRAWSFFNAVIPAAADCQLPNGHVKLTGMWRKRIAAGD
jgi:hypothetical protein